MQSDRAESKAGPEGCASSFNRTTVLRLAGMAAVALSVANCSNGRSAFDPKYGVSASPRVVADGQPVPKGGGREMVGKPYVVAGRTYVPQENPHYSGVGLASWYGSNFHGRRTANGEIFDSGSIAAAHTTMPLPSYARVTNLENGRSMIVRVNDRGPFHGNRIIDVSERAASALGFRGMGTAQVRVDYVGPASPNGSDDRILLASLRTDGMPASLSKVGPTMVAQASPRGNARPDPLALLRPVPSDAVSTAFATASEPTQTVASAGPIGTASRIPLPPERPFDLGTIPGAATPVAVISSLSPTALPPSRPMVAGLYYAPETPREGFEKTGTFRPLDQSHFVMR